MDWNAFRVLGPPCVRTPDLSDDVSRYFAPLAGVDQDLADLDQRKRQVLTLLAERLELVEHLATISDRLGPPKRTEARFRPRGAGFVQVTLNETIHLWGHDFSGADHDLEALQLYLLLTCVDTVVQGSGNEYAAAFEWLFATHAQSLATARDEGEVERVLQQAKSEYQEEHGLARGFVRAFVSELPDDIRDRLADGFAVVKLETGRVARASSQAWERRNREDKLKALARQLYAMRSRFSHTSLRSFCPVVPVRFLQGKQGEKVLVSLRQDEDLLKLLWDVVVALARRLVIGLGG